MVRTETFKKKMNTRMSAAERSESMEVMENTTMEQTPDDCSFNAMNPTFIQLHVHINIIANYGS